MKTVSDRDKTTIRDLAKKYLDLCNDDRNKRAVKLWSKLNNLEETRPLVYTSTFFTSDFLKPEVDEALEPNQTEHFRDAETWFKRFIWHGTYIKDDSVFDPWYPMESVRKTTNAVWGLELVKHSDPGSHGYRFDPAIRTLEDVDRLVATPHEVIDREPENVRMMRDAVGDILPVHVKCSTVYPIWYGTDLSEAMGKMVGLEEYMIMMYEEPEILHKLMAFMRDAVLANIEQGEKAGDWSTADGCSYTFLHTNGLPEPKANSYGAKLKDLWFFTHAQEFEPVGPALHKEFLLDYQMPIMEKFAYVSYGCCETLDKKLDLLKTIPNLRRICAGPKADVVEMGKCTGKNYILSWRPSPAMVSFDYDLENCRNIVRAGFKGTKGCPIELMLKEMMTVQHDLRRLKEFTEMAIAEAESV